MGRSASEKIRRTIAREKERTGKRGRERKSERDAREYFRESLSVLGL